MSFTRGSLCPLNVDLRTDHHALVRAFQFAIQIDSIRYANRFESIRIVKKSVFRFTSCHAVFSCLFIV